MATKPSGATRCAAPAKGNACPMSQSLTARTTVIRQPP